MTPACRCTALHAPVRGPLGNLPFRESLWQPATAGTTVNGGDFSLAVDGQTVLTKHDVTYSGGIVDFAVEPRGIITITAVTLYPLP